MKQFIPILVILLLMASLSSGASAVTTSGGCNYSEKLTSVTGAAFTCRSKSLDREILEDPSGLIWIDALTTNGSLSKLSFDEAEHYCASAGGHLPSYTEFSQLAWYLGNIPTGVQIGLGYSAYSKNGLREMLVGLSKNDFWSSDDFDSVYHGVFSGRDGTENGTASLKAGVLCVQPTPKYEDLSSVDFQDAAAQCAKEGGRLPTPRELAQLMIDTGAKGSREPILKGIPISSEQVQLEIARFQSASYSPVYKKDSHGQTVVDFYFNSDGSNFLGFSRSHIPEMIWTISQAKNGIAYTFAGDFHADSAGSSKPVRAGVRCMFPN